MSNATLPQLGLPELQSSEKAGHIDKTDYQSRLSRINAGRRRATRACDGCRKVKEKCEGGVPCRRCTHLRRACEFRTLASRERKTRSASQSRRLPMSSNNETAIRNMFLERIIKHHFPEMELDTESLRRISEDIEKDRPNVAPSTHSRSDHATDEENVAIEERPTIQPLEGNIAHYAGEFSYWNFSMSIKRHVENVIASSKSQDRPHFSHVREFWRAGQLDSTSNALKEALSCCPPRYVSDFLVYVFFKYAETSYFYVEKNWLLEKVELLHANPHQFCTKDAGVVGIVLAVFAIGTQYAYLDSPNPGEKNNPDASSDDELGSVFYQHAKRLLPEIIEVASLESVQACLLLGIYSLAVDVSGLAYIYLNLAIKLGMQNGMHRKFISNEFDPVTIETRNRVWWSASAIEKKISALHGRPISVDRSYIDAEKPRELVDMSSNRPTLVSHMLISLRLMDFLEDCHDQLLLFRKCKKHELSGILTRLFKSKESLIAWWEGISQDVLVSGQQSNPADFRSRMQLRLEYCLTRMFAGRPFLFDCNSQPEAGLSRAHSGNRSTRVSKLADDCVKAATEAIEICRQLRDSEAGLARAAYVEYSSCRASLLVLIAYCIQNRTDKFHSFLQNGLSMIRVMSATGDSAKAEVSLIEALERARVRLQCYGMDSGGGETSGLTDPTSPSSYDRFKQWQSSWKSGNKSKPTDPDQLREPVQEQAGHSLSPAAQQTNTIQDWPTCTSGGSSDVAMSVDMNSIVFDPGSLVTDSAFFDLENIPLSIDGLAIPERQVLEDFLALSDQNFAMAAANGNAHFSGL